MQASKGEKKPTVLINCDAYKFEQYAMCVCVSIPIFPIVFFSDLFIFRLSGGRSLKLGWSLSVLYSSKCHSVFLLAEIRALNS